MFAIRSRSGCISVTVFAARMNVYRHLPAAILRVDSAAILIDREMPQIVRQSFVSYCWTIVETGQLDYNCNRRFSTGVIAPILRLKEVQSPPQTTPVVNHLKIVSHATGVETVEICTNDHRTANCQVGPDRSQLGPTQFPIDVRLVNQKQLNVTQV